MKKYIGILTLLGCLVWLISFLFKNPINSKKIEPIKKKSRLETKKIFNKEKEKNKAKEAHQKILINKFTDAEVKQIKQLRSNAGMSLSANYTALKTFYEDYKRYSTDLFFQGFSLQSSNENNIINYKFGFLKSFRPNGLLQEYEVIENPDYKDSDYFIDHYLDRDGRSFYYSDEIRSFDLSSLKKYCEYDCSAGKDHFELVFVFSYPQNQGYEVWLMNHKKEIKKVGKFLPQEE